MHYALNCGDRGIEIYSAPRAPKVRKTVAETVKTIGGKKKTIRIIKILVKGGKLIGSWSKHHATLVFPSIGEPGELVKVNSGNAVTYNSAFDRIDQGA